MNRRAPENIARTAAAILFMLGTTVFVAAEIYRAARSVILRSSGVVPARTDEPLTMRALEAGSAWLAGLDPAALLPSAAAVAAGLILATVVAVFVAALKAVGKLGTTSGRLLRDGRPGLAVLAGLGAVVGAVALAWVVFA